MLDIIHNLLCVFCLTKFVLCPGDVILREEPYAAALESVFRVNHCAHCLKKTATPISCFECATVSEDRMITSFMSTNVKLR